MNYQVLARKWRPKKFSDIAGQKDIIAAIIHSFSLNRIHHSYILSGTRGAGKTTIARLFAKGLNCEQGLSYDMCGRCKNCKDIELGCFTDLVEIDAAYYTKVEDTRDFLDNVQYTPSCGRFKIYLIDEVHMLSKHSFNALLKLLEEPPHHVKFILVTTEYQKLPETILSRCLQFHLKPLGVSQIVTRLLYICNIEHINVAEDSLRLLAIASKGSMRDALNLLEQAILLSNNNITVNIIHDMLGTLCVDQALSLIENLINRDIDNLMHQIDKYAILGINWDSLFKEILILFQKIAINQFSSNFFKEHTNNNDIINIESRIYNLSNHITPENVQLYYQIFLLARSELPYAPSYRIGIEMAILRALAFFPANIDLDNKKNGNSQNVLLHNENDSCEKKNIISNTIHNNINTDIYQNTQLALTQDHYSEHNLLDVKKSDSFKSVKTISDFTSKILKIRSNLVEHQKYASKKKDNNIQLYLDIKSKQVTEYILDKFSDIHVNIQDSYVDNKKKIIKYYH